MSLDVYLISKETVLKEQSSGIFIRENGQTKEITVEEWNLRHPDIEPVKLLAVDEELETNEVYSANITHNLNTMADKAGIYKHLWRPDEIEISRAKDLIEPLTEGLNELKSNPEKYKQYNPENGWGTYEVLVEFVENYLNACHEYPDAGVEVCR